MPTSTQHKKNTYTRKTGGNALAKDVTNMMVPFGLILAKKSLENFLKSKDTKTKSATSQKSARASASGRKKSASKKPSSKKVSLSGGYSPCSKINNNTNKVEGYSTTGKYAPVGGKK